MPRTGPGTQQGSVSACPAGRWRACVSRVPCAGVATRSDRVVFLVKALSSGPTLNSYPSLLVFGDILLFHIQKQDPLKRLIVVVSGMIMLAINGVLKTPGPEKNPSSAERGAGFELLGAVSGGTSPGRSWSPCRRFLSVCCRCHQLHQPAGHRRRQGAEALQRPQEVHVLRDVRHVRAERGEGLPGR